MSLRQQILDELTERADKALAGLIGTIDAERLRKEAAPCKQYHFHRLMWVRLPEWRKLAVAWHRMRMRRWEAKCDVKRMNICAKAYGCGQG